LTPSGNNPTTFQFVAQCLNHWATACPLHDMDSGKYVCTVKYLVSDTRSKNTDRNDMAWHQQGIHFDFINNA
jgi:hypothetical protein